MPIKAERGAGGGTPHTPVTAWPGDTQAGTRQVAEPHLTIRKHREALNEGGGCPPRQGRAKEATTGRRDTRRWRRRRAGERPVPTDHPHWQMRPPVPGQHWDPQACTPEAKGPSPPGQKTGPSSTPDTCCPRGLPTWTRSRAGRTQKPGQGECHWPPPHGLTSSRRCRPLPPPLHGRSGFGCGAGACWPPGQSARRVFTSAPSSRPLLSSHFLAQKPLVSLYVTPCVAPRPAVTLWLQFPDSPSADRGHIHRSRSLRGGPG